MRLAYAFPLVLGACFFDSSTSAVSGDDAALPPDSSTRIDAAVPDAQNNSDPDASIVDAAPPDAEPCYGEFLEFDPLNFDKCDLPEGGDALELSEDLGDGYYLLDSDTGLLTDPNNNTTQLPYAFVPQVDAPEIGLVVVESLQVDFSAGLGIYGTRAIVIVSKTDMDIAGTIDAVGFTNNGMVFPGPGGNDPVACADGAGQDGELIAPNNDPPAGTGGGGGAFGDEGGRGGRIEGSNERSEGGSPVAGAPNNPPSLVPLRGGCPGGKGGNGIDENGDENQGGGLGGAGGGALQLVAAGSILLQDAIVSVSGSGGQGVSDRSSGGGGGGSGGGLLFQARVVSGTPHALTAGGGGGGEGSRTNDATAAGTDGFLDDDSPAPGGSGESTGGNGDSGGSSTESADDGDDGNSGNTVGAGGGGGGGSYGAIRTVVEDGK